MAQVMFERRPRVQPRMDGVPGTPGRPDGSPDYPYRAGLSNFSFYRPPTLINDFQRQVDTEIPGFTFSFEIIKDWYNQFELDYIPWNMRCVYYPIAWKSKIGNSDLNSNFFAPKQRGPQLHKGDMIIREDSEIMMLNWKVQEQVNAWQTQAIDCNLRITITRYQPEQWDQYGHALTTNGEVVVVNDLPCMMARYTGRPDYVVALNAPGLHPDDLYEGQLQWNSQTRTIQINDEFVWMDQKYRIIWINQTELDSKGEYGILRVYAKHVASGDLGVRP